MPDAPPPTAPRPVTVVSGTRPRTADVAVIGAGVAGLTLARAILRAAPSTRLIVLESGDRAGGQLTLHEFVERRFGAEPAGAVLTALVQGITGGDPRATNMRALLPPLWELDQAAGGRSLLLHAMWLRARKPTTTRTGQAGSATLRGGGLGMLAETLAASLGSALEYGQTARAVSPGGRCRYSVQLVTGAVIEADTVVLAVPAHRAARLLAAMTPATAAALDRIEFTDMRVIGLGYPQSEFASMPPGFGFLSPPGQGLDIIGATVSSNAFESQAPPGHVLLRAFAGGVFAPHIADLDHGEMLGVVKRDLRRVLGVHGEPDFVRDVVWRQALPQYLPDHLSTLERLEDALCHLPGLHVTGNSYRGPGLGDTIRQAVQLAAVLAGEQTALPTTARTPVSPGPRSAACNYRED